MALVLVNGIYINIFSTHMKYIYIASPRAGILENETVFPVLQWVTSVK